MIRTRWWYPLWLILITISAFYGLLRVDQYVADLVVWPVDGAHFVEVGLPAPQAKTERLGTMVIVAGGLNLKSGTAIAAALLPSLSGPNTRVFSLVYGSGIYDPDIQAKFDELYRRYDPVHLNLLGSSMGGDVVLNIARHFQSTYADPERYRPGHLVPSIGTVFLDCTPMGTDDVRYGARTQADFLTGLTEAVGTDGGAGTRLVAELLAQQKQWSSGMFPYLTIRPDDLAFKWAQVVRDKISPSGVSTALIKDQYGVIRRFEADAVFGSLGVGTQIVFLRPDIAQHDYTIDVAAVQDRLIVLSAAYGLNLTVLTVAGGSHASAIRDAATYNQLIRAYRTQAARATDVAAGR